jgi:phosphate transport system protein
MHLVGALRNLERLADHATNIAEDVIFVVNGRIVRHHMKQLDEEKAAKGAVSARQGD